MDRVHIHNVSLACGNTHKVGADLTAATAANAAVSIVRSEYNRDAPNMENPSQRTYISFGCGYGTVSDA